MTNFRPQGTVVRSTLGHSVSIKKDIMNRRSETKAASFADSLSVSGSSIGARPEKTVSRNDARFNSQLFMYVQIRDSITTVLK